jgi:hypothetical protein
MKLDRVYNMRFGNVYPFYVAKVEKKGRTKAELDEVISWLTGYTPEGLNKAIDSDMTIKEFFDTAPHMNDNRTLITGTICGVRIEDIKEDTMREIRYLDKLVDELAKGRPMAKILRA